MKILTQIPVEIRQQKGILPGYGETYDLDDFFVSTDTSVSITPKSLCFEISSNSSR